MSTRNQRPLLLGLLCAGQFMVVLDATVVLVALPSIGAALKFVPQDLSWVINAYTLLFGGFLLLGGRASDLFGRRRLFMIGLAIFSGGSLLCALSPSSGILVTARALQGFGGAMVSPAALSLLINLYSEGKDRNQALGVWGAMGAIGGSAGLLLGGFLTSAFGWQSIFLVNVPIGIAVLLLTLRMLPADQQSGLNSGFDLPGAVTLTLGLILLVYSATSISANGLLSAITLGVTGAAMLLLIAFVIIETRTKNPLIRLDIFRLRQLSSANVINLLISAAQGSLFFLLTLYMQDILHYSPLQSGAAIVPVGIGIIIFSNIAPRLITARGIKPILIVGLIGFGASLALLLRLPVDGNYVRDLLPTFVIASVGMGFFFVAITIGAFIGVPEKDTGLASGLINTTAQFGNALGVAILGAIAASQTQFVLSTGASSPDAMLSGYRLSFAVSVGIVIVSLMVALIGVRGKSTISPPVPAVEIPAATAFDG